MVSKEEIEEISAIVDDYRNYYCDYRFTVVGGGWLPQGSMEIRVYKKNSRHNVEGQRPYPINCYEYIPIDSTPSFIKEVFDHLIMAVDEIDLKPLAWVRDS